MIVVGSAGIFFGLANPSMNNAGLELAPDRIASVTGLRGMFMNLGGTIGIAFVVLIASRAGNTGDGLALAFTLLAVMLFISMLVIPALPEISTKSRRAPPNEARTAETQPVTPGPLADDA
jgi:MFS family permease